MSSQSELFDEWAAKQPKLPALPRNPCTAAKVGSGPQGETCGSCAFKLRVKYHDKSYLKCGLMEKHWTHGGASDIRAKWPACREWKAKAE